MKNLRGYLTAAIFAGITYVLSQYGQKFSALVDMVYPYVIRTLEQSLAQWSSQADFLIWQLLAVALLVIVVAALVVVIITKKNLFQWFGWVLAAGSFVFMLHTMIYGMNYYAGSLSEDMRMQVGGSTLDEIVEATEYYQRQANAMADQVSRDAYGDAVFEDFDILASRAGSGFQYLTYNRSYPVFAGSTLPVKKLGWADMYSSMGITGVWYVGEIAIGCVLFALVMAKPIKRVSDELRNVTFPELIHARYDQKNSTMASITTILAMIGYTAAQFVAGASILNVLTGWNLGVCYILAAVVIVFYVSTGGLLAVTYTDIVQMALLLLGIVVLAVPLVGSQLHKMGANLVTDLPASFFDLGAWGWPTILALGLSTIISKIYGYDGYYALIVVVLPAFIWGIPKIKKLSADKKAELSE